MIPSGIRPAPYPCDLHSHTVLSDGNDTPLELIEHAVARGLRVLAITDHDVLPPRTVELPGGKSKEIGTYAAERGLVLFKGIEFSCETTVQDVHIVGLECDWELPALQQEERAIARSKVDAYVETIARLNERGYPIELQEVLEFGGRPIPLEKLQKKRLFDFMAAKGYASSWSEAKLMVRDDPYLNVEREKPSAEHIIGLIHKAGGIAILAHPFLIDETVESSAGRESRNHFIQRLIGSGLDGIESRYTYAKTTCKDQRPQEELWREAEELAAGRLILSAGSDYHADAKKGIPNQRDLGECGLTMEEMAADPVWAGLLQKAGVPHGHGMGDTGSSDPGAL